MNDFEQLIIGLGIEPSIALAILAILSAILIVMTVLYICVPFALLRIRKEIIEMNKSLRIFYILGTQTTSNLKTEAVSKEENETVAESNEDNETEVVSNDDKSSKNIIKLKLDDEDIKKLKAIGTGME